MANNRYKRVLLKLSGQSLCKPGGFGIDSDSLAAVAQKVIDVCKLNIEVAIVVGAGNILRGQAFSQDSLIPRQSADYMGMLATIINACSLQETLVKMGQPAKVLSAIDVPAICDKFTKRDALDHFKNGNVVVLAGGTGNPFFTTDTCAALRACEIDADLIIKATKVDGVYSDDPVKNPDAEFYPQISYEDVLKENLKIMDQAAISLCRENKIKVIVLNIFKDDNMTKALCGEKIGTLIS